MDFLQTFFFQQDYLLSRYLFQRSLAFIYFIGFLNIKNQYLPLLGRRGLMPINRFVKEVSFWNYPSLFFRYHSDRILELMSYLGLALSFLCMTGLSENYGLAFSMLCWTSLWILYLSYVNLGQLFYAYGWESLLLETGFLAVFLGDQGSSPPFLILYLLRFICFKNLLGAGLIKLRGDSSWKDNTALYYHFETQPIPNPLSLYFHNLPKFILRLGVVFNHFIELIIPFFCLVPGWGGIIAAFLAILFQIILIFSGNLSWLNYLSIVLCIPCISDDFWNLFLIFPSQIRESTLFWFYSTTFVSLCLIYCNRKPVKNLFSKYQSMNRSYDPLHLCNTYGAFGSVTKKRYELVILGTRDVQVTKESQWKEYKFYGKPNLETDRPAMISPYHRRLDWQIWFSAMGSYHHSPWLFVFIYKLLKAEPSLLKLIKQDPFAGERPQYIKIDKYHYKMPKLSQHSKLWWHRSYESEFLPPISLEDKSLNEIVQKLT